MPDVRVHHYGFGLEQLEAALASMHARQAAYDRWLASLPDSPQAQYLRELRAGKITQTRAQAIAGVFPGMPGTSA